MRFERRGFRGRGGYGGGYGESRVDLPKPINVGEKFDVEITEVGSRGDGIARIKNFVVFVNGAKQGEKIKVEIKEVRNRFAIADKVGEGSAEVAVAAPVEEVEETKEEVKDSAEEVTEDTEEVTEDAEETEEETEG